MHAAEAEIQSTDAGLSGLSGSLNGASLVKLKVFHSSINLVPLISKTEPNESPDANLAFKALFALTSRIVSRNVSYPVIRLNIYHHLSMISMFILLNHLGLCLNIHHWGFGNSTTALDGMNN